MFSGKYGSFRHGVLELTSLLPFSGNEVSDTGHIHCCDLAVKIGR